MAGLLMIVWTLYSSYNIFTGKTVPPEFFEMSVKKEVSLPGGETGAQGVQAQLQKMIEEQLQGILPTDSLPKLLNLAVWSMLAFILIFGGSQVSSLGIKLIKK